jgi:hypothetical protein
MTTKGLTVRMNAVWDNMTVEAHTRLYLMYQGYTHTLEGMCKESGCGGTFTLRHMTDCEFVPYHFKTWIKLNLDSLRYVTNEPVEDVDSVEYLEPNF